MKLGVSFIGKNKIVVAIYDEEFKRLRIVRVSTFNDLREIVNVTKPKEIYLDESALELKEGLSYLGEVKESKEISEEELNNKLKEIELLSLIKKEDMSAIKAVLSDQTS